MVSESDDGSALFRLVQVVLRNRRDRFFQDIRVLASPLREPCDDQQERPDEEDRKSDDLRRDRVALPVRGLHDEPLRQARDRRPGDAEQPPDEAERQDAHLPFRAQVHTRAPFFCSQRPYQNMIPMNTRPITTWATNPPTAHGHGVSRRNVPENGDPAIVTPWSGSTTGPFASVNVPYRFGPPAGIGLTVGAAGMFPTFWTDTPTWRCRKVGWSDRTTKVASYLAPGISWNDDAPIHWLPVGHAEEPVQLMYRPIVAKSRPSRVIQNRSPRTAVPATYRNDHVMTRYSPVFISIVG